MEGVVEIEKRVKRDFGDNSKIQSAKLSVDYAKAGLDGTIFDVDALIDGKETGLVYFVGLRGGEIYAERVKAIAGNID